MKWPLRNCGATYLRDVTDTVQTVRYSDSQFTLYTVTILARASTLQGHSGQYSTRLKNEDYFKKSLK